MKHILILLANLTFLTLSAQNTVQDSPRFIQNDKKKQVNSNTDFWITLNQQPFSIGKGFIKFVVAEEEGQAFLNIDPTKDKKELLKLKTKVQNLGKEIEKMGARKDTIGLLSMQKKLAQNKAISLREINFQLLNFQTNATLSLINPQEENITYFNIDSQRYLSEKVMKCDGFIYKNIYPNIDWKITVEEQNLMQEFILNEGADIQNIKYRYNGTTMVKEDGGILQVSTALTTFNEQIEIEDNASGSYVQKIKREIHKDTIGFSATSAQLPLSIKIHLTQKPSTKTKQSVIETLLNEQ